MTRALYNSSPILAIFFISVSCVNRDKISEHQTSISASNVKSTKTRYTKDFLNPTEDEIRAESQETDNLRNLADYESLPLPTIKEGFKLPSGKIVNLVVEQRQALYLPIHLQSPLNLDKATLKYNQTYSDAHFENLNEETLKELQSHFQVNREMKLSITTNHNLLEFLPPEMQGLANRRGFTGALIDCYATAYSRLVETQLAHLISRTEDDFGFSDSKKFELLADLASDDFKAIKSQAQKLSFGDVINFAGQHITTVLTPNLVWEKTNGGTAPFHIIDLDAVVEFWGEKPGSENAKTLRFKFYRPKKGLQLERVIKFESFHPKFGNVTNFARNVLFKQDSSGLAFPFLPSKATAKASGIKMFQTDDQTKLSTAPSCSLNKDQTIGLNNIIKIKNNLSLLDIKVPSSGCPQFKGTVLIQAFDDLSFN